MGSLDTNFEKTRESRKSLPIILLKSISSGMLGFMGFLAVLLATKYLGYISGSVNTFKIETEDLFLCLIGFIFSFLIKILSSYQETGNQE